MKVQLSKKIISLLLASVLLAGIISAVLILLLLKSHSHQEQLTLVVNQANFNNLNFLWILDLFIVLTSLLIIFYLKKSIFSPIKQLTNATSEISKTRNYHIRLNSQFNKEVNELYQAFNQFLEVIEIHDVAKSQAEDAVQESEIRYRSLFQLSPIPILVYDKESILFLNLAAINALAGSFAKDFIGNSIESIIHQDSLESFLNPNNSIDINEFKLIKKDNSLIYVEAKQNYIEYKGKPAFQLVFQDVSERKINEQEILKLNQELEQRVIKRTEQLDKINKALEKEISERKQIEIELRESEERFRAMFNSTLDSIAVWNRNKEFVFANQVFIKHTEINKNDFLNKKLETALNHLPELANLFSHRLSNTFNNPVTIQVIDKVLIKDSEKYLESIFLPIINANNEINLAGVVYRDITERIKSEEKIKKYTDQLEFANQELEAFSYSISHDLRAPLRSIHGFTKILLEDELENLSNDGKRHLSIVHDNSKYMGELINDLLNFSRMNRKPLQKQNLNIRTVIDEVFETLNIDIQKSKLQINIDSALNKNIRADASLVKQIYMNLLENSIKYSSKTENPLIEIGIIENDGIFFVKDNGVGFDMHYADNVFDVFKRLHRNDEFTGTGVGLAIVKRIVSRHGGKIWVESKKNVGSTFYFTLE